MKITRTDSWRLAHNTLLEGARIMLIMPVLLLIAIVTIPLRLLRGRKP